MGDSYRDIPHNEGNRGSFRGGRGPGNREGGGFRIRLSDNEMRAARSLQEAFRLRSTVAVLGFALRTLAEMLEQGKLDELITQHRSQQQNGGGRRDDSNRRGGNHKNLESAQKGPKPNPFARPAKPQAAKPQSEDAHQSSQDELENTQINEEKISTANSLVDSSSSHDQTTSETPELTNPSEEV